MLISKIRAQIQEAYHRALILEHGIRYVKDFLLARVWFTTQIPTATDFDRWTQQYHGSYGKAQTSESRCHVTMAERVRGQSSDTHNGKIYDTIHVENGEARTRDRYFHCRLPHEVATTWTNTVPSTNKVNPRKIRLSLSIQHRIGIRTHKRYLRTSATL